mmetsp:Transcript_21119/g.25994  ORF Transcript_21119/g.25994 Transcript_21119/m.25994 type:complete len:117 (-) Transcript_21119:394-744(-)
MMAIIVLKFLKQFGPSQMSNPISLFGRIINAMEDEDGSTTTVFLLELLESTLFSLMVLYFIWVTQRGNYTIGQRHALFTFYLMKENETLLDSFIVNVAINNIVSIAAIHYTSLIFF